MEKIKKYWPFIIGLSISIIYAILIPLHIPEYTVHSDTWQYLGTTDNLHDTYLRPIGYPLILKFCKLTGNFTLALKIIQILLCAGIFQLIYQVIKNKWIIILLLLSGAYITRIPYIMADLIFCFYFIASYYFLLKKKLPWHFLFIALASITKPNLAAFFLIEPFLIYWKYQKDIWLALSCGAICFLVSFIMPVKNWIEYGQPFHSRILEYILQNEWYHHPVKNLFAHGFTTHWNYLFNLLGYYKRDLTDGIVKLSYSPLVKYINWFFYGFYAVIWSRFLYLKFKIRDYASLLLVSYFMIPTLLICPTGGRYRLLIEFLLF